MTSFVNQSKSSTSFTNQTKNSNTFDFGLGFLLQEIGAYILQENGGKFILEESYNYKKPISFTNQIKH
ncbi:MAG: hypothetical protein WC511_06640 [Candidatus Pacearchaeota archaeon]|jgi:hypothetical protein